MPIDSSIGAIPLTVPRIASDIVAGLQRFVQDGAQGHGNPATVAQPETEAYLSGPALRNVLFTLGVSTDAATMAIADALTRYGVPLTQSALSDAHVALGMAPGASAAAYALAQSTGLPSSPATLMALTELVENEAPQLHLPAEILERLAFIVDAGGDPEKLAAQIRSIVRDLGQSAENRLLGLPNSAGNLRDTRTLLLDLAANSDDRNTAAQANKLASQIEGQQLVNQTAAYVPAHLQPAPVYFAIPLQFPGEESILEIKVKPRDEDGKASEKPDSEFLVATIRTSTERLGRIQADLRGTFGGSLSCKMASDRPATMRLFQRNAADLADSLATMGWSNCSVKCVVTTDFPPLWNGGTALVSPRQRVDRRV